MSLESIEFNGFMWLANTFYKGFGMVPYKKDKHTRHAHWLDVLFVIQIVNLNFVLLIESIYVVLAFKNNNNFVDSVMNLSYMGFGAVGEIKIWSIWLQKAKITTLARHLESIYPQGAELQQEFNAGRFLRTYRKISFWFYCPHLILIWIYNLFPLLSYIIYDFLLHVHKVPIILPYFVWLPWDWHNHLWTYPCVYLSLNLAGHTCMLGQIASDLLLCVAAIQVIMHFQQLARTIESFEAKHDKTDMEFLVKVIEYHQKILHISDLVNDIFGVSLLINFLSSSFTMCFLGFRMTVGGNPDDLLMLCLFLGCSLIQVYMICNYGQQMILASESVGHAVYKHNWHNSDVRHKKMMVLIIQRSQKPAVMKATSFLNISLGTMTDLLQLSYKFFALLRTMYSD